MYYSIDCMDWQTTKQSDMQCSNSTFKHNCIWYTEQHVMFTLKQFKLHLFINTSISNGLKNCFYYSLYTISLTIKMKKNDRTNSTKVLYRNTHSIIIDMTAVISDPTISGLGKFRRSTGLVEFDWFTLPLYWIGGVGCTLQCLVREHVNETL